nr:cyclin-dependent protein kinase inhibitor SIM-like [Nicotiana tomentosiformis]
MSTDLEFQQDFLENHLPNVKITSSQNSNNTDERCSSTISNEDECHTPKSPQFLLPKILNCPTAPKKPKRIPSCKRKLLDHELQFFEIVARDEVDSFFRTVDGQRRNQNLKFMDSQTTAAASVERCSGSSTSEENKCLTPTSPKFFIPKILSCPPAPKKPKKVALSKRKLVDERQILRVIDVNSIGCSRNRKRRCL